MHEKAASAASGCGMMVFCVTCGLPRLIKSIIYCLPMTVLEADLHRRPAV